MPATFDIALPYPPARLLITIDTSEVDAWIKRYISDINQTGPLLEEIAKILRRAFAANFSAGGRPGWAPLAPSTIAAKNRAGLPALTGKGNIPKRLMQKGGFGGANSILLGSGALRDSYVQQGARGHVENIDVDNNTVEVGSQITTDKGAPYAVFLDVGTNPYNIPNAFGRGRTVAHPGLVARPQTLGDDDLAQIRQAVVNFIQSVGE